MQSATIRIFKQSCRINNIVDKFVFNDDSVSRLLEDILTSQKSHDQRNQQERTVDGRFLCRFPGYQASFKYDGVRRRTHELSHDPPVDFPSQQGSEQSTAEPCNKPTDDVYSYSCALLADGLFFINFLDAVKEGDDVRLMRHYKYSLLYCRADASAINKYALECLYQSFLVQSVVNPVGGFPLDSLAKSGFPLLICISAFLHTNEGLPAY